jgi:hypothetical protein
MRFQKRCSWGFWSGGLLCWRRGDTSLKTRIPCPKHNFVSCDFETEMKGVSTATVFKVEADFQCFLDR